MTDKDFDDFNDESEEELALRIEIHEKEFKKRFDSYYRKFIDSIRSRDNYNTGHLKNLDILCRLYVEYDFMTEAIDRKFVEYGNKYSLENKTRYGVQSKVIPELNERDKIMKLIMNYTKILDLVLAKDASNNEDEEVKSEWDM